jgi:hypothetical protein
VKAALFTDSSSDWNLASLIEMAAALASRLKEIGAGILVSGVDWTKSAQLYAAPAGMSCRFPLGQLINPHGIG